MSRYLLLAVIAVVALMASLGTPRATADTIVPINFVRGELTGAGFATNAPTAMAFAPDGRLYVADNDGVIRAVTIDANTMTVTAVETITTATEIQEIYGIAFDPNDASTPPPIYITNTVSGFGDEGTAPAGAFAGKVTKISGAGYSTIEDVITGLPVSNSGHQANALAFGPDGRLYVAQGSTTNAGIINPSGVLFQRDEVPTSGALLVADVHAPGFDGNIVYSPAGTYSTSVEQIGGDVSVHASGLRNPYDVLFHSNGLLYNTDNGPNSGYGPSSVTCTTDSGTDTVAADELNVIVAGAYYGHPNRNRGLAGDARQCTYHPGTEASNAEYTAPIALLPPSSNGLAEYASDRFAGQMQGDLLYVSWVEHTLRRVVLSPDGQSVGQHTTLAEGFTNPLDVVVGSDGTIYVAEWGANKITFLRPDETPVTDITVTAIQPPGGPTSGGQSVTITGTNFTTSADTSVTIGGAALTSVVVENSTTITGVTSANTVGLKDVVVTNSIGSDTLVAGYNYSEGGGVIPPVANAGPDWSGPVGHEIHAHVTLDGRGSTDDDGFIVSYEWYEGETLLSTNPVDSIEFTLGEHLVTLKVTDNDNYTDTDDVRVIVTATADNPLPYFCFDVDGDTDVDPTDLALVAGSYGSQFTPSGYTAAYGRMRDYNADRLVNSGDLLGVHAGATPSCSQVDREIREATVWMEQYQNINDAIADGFVQITPWIPGQGRHMVRGANLIDALAGQDNVFIAGEPESLLYEPDSSVPGGWRLGGGMWIMPIDQVPIVPEGFTGNEDAWHYHNGLCIWNNGAAVAEDVPQTYCQNTLGGIWLEKAGWLVHLWNFHANPIGRFVEVNDDLAQPASSGNVTVAVDAQPLAPGIQSSVAASAGPLVVDIVAVNAGDVAAFNFDLEYDSNVLSAPVIAGSSLDQNPDANQAFLESSGRDFQCSPPAPNPALNPGATKVARIACYSNGTAPGADSGSGAVLASVTFDAVGAVGGGTALTLKNVNVFDHDAIELASCAPTVSITGTCEGATIVSTSEDADGDSIVDDGDNCPNVANASQADGDSDELGDACEGNYGTNPADGDTDDDGCFDGREARAVFPPNVGGDRDPLYYWDFFDVTGDSTIDFSDTLDVLTLFGDPAVDGTPADLRDRTILDAGKPWRTSEADDGIDFSDALGTLSSFGHTCL